MPGCVRHGPHCPPGPMWRPWDGQELIGSGLVRVVGLDRPTGFQDHWVKSCPVKSLRVCGGSGRITMRSTVGAQHNRPSAKPAQPLNIGFDCSSSQFIRLYLPLSARGPFRQLNCCHFLAGGSSLLPGSWPCKPDRPGGLCCFRRSSRGSHDMVLGQVL
jgi:hypothetical protein